MKIEEQIKNLIAKADYYNRKGNKEYVRQYILPRLELLVDLAVIENSREKHYKFVCIECKIVLDSVAEVLQHAIVDHNVADDQLRFWINRKIVQIPRC